MPQLTFDDGFYHASMARDIAVGNGSGNTTVLTEINSLQVLINAAAVAQELEITVTSATTMTTFDDYNGAGTSSHFDAWNNLDLNISLDPAQESTLRRAQIEMDRVIAYFTRLGYSIKREQNGIVNEISWKIKW